MAELFLEIVSPDLAIFNDTVESVTIPGTLGGFQILKNHAPLISTFEIGVIKILKDDTPVYFTTAGGTVEVKDNKILVLADSIERVADIDTDRAEKAKQRAEERLARKHDADIDEVRAEAALKRALNRLNAVQKFM